MKLLVGESSGATGENVDCGGRCKTDFSDLRFTAADGTTLLDYWIESVTGTTPNQLATVWIEFDSIGTGATTFYMYYGNSGASSSSSGANTFPFFDDFPGSSLDAAKWNASSGASVGSGVLTLSGQGTHGYAISKNSLTSPHRIICRAKTGVKGSVYIRFGYHANMVANTNIVGVVNGYRTNESDTATHGANIQKFSGGWATVGNASYALSDNTFYKAILTSLGSGANNLKIAFLADDYSSELVYVQGSDTTYTSGYFALIVYGSAETPTTAIYDYVFATNYVATEPAWGSWGAEEADTPPLNYYTLALEAGAFSMSGIALLLKKESIIALGSTSYSTIGKDVRFPKALAFLTLEAGSFALTGSDVVLHKISRMKLDPATYLIDGKAMNPIYSWYRGASSSNYQFHKQRRTF